MASKCALGVIAAALLLTTASIPQATPPKPAVVSLIQLIANPDKYDGKPVAVIGFLRLEHEADLLYLGKDDYENVILPNTLWVDATEEMGKDRNELEMKYVRIEGIFKAGHEQRNMVSVGGLTGIKECKLWSDPLDPLEGKIKRMPK